MLNQIYDNDTIFIYFCAKCHELIYLCAKNADIRCPTCNEFINDDDNNYKGVYL